MPRTSRSEVHVEILMSRKGELEKWALYKNGFKRIPDAEQWVGENLREGLTLRVVKISGRYSKRAVVTKR